MNNKMLIVIKNFYPSISASGNLLKKLTDSLGKMVDVIVLTRKDNVELKKEEVVNNTEVHRIYIKKSIIDKYYEKGNIVKYAKIIFLLLKGIRYIGKQISIKNYSYKNVKKIEKHILQIIDKEHISIIMPITLEEIIATLRVAKKRNINIVPYLFEVIPVYESLPIFNIFQKIRNYRIEKIKKTLYEKSRMIFVLPVLSKYFQDTDKKVIITEHPMIVNETLANNNVEENTVITYAGGLDLNIRNPEKILEIFQKMYNQKMLQHTKIYFFSYGNCQSMLEKCMEHCVGVFYSMGKVIPDIAHKRLKQSNIIITIGNHNSKLVPSKLFDCVSTGKPILHFYYDKDDIYIEYLKKYRLSKCIDLNRNIEENVEEIYRFIKETCNKCVQFQEIVNEYKECTPEYVAGVIKETLESIC